MKSTCDKNKARYRVDLTDLHSLCEGNYARAKQLFPDYERANQRRILAGDAQVALEVVERSRYTTTLLLTHVSPLELPAGGVKLHLRLYHDARMAEVVAFQTHRHLEGRYAYPNAKMYQRDEKHQQNRYVAELLTFCLAEGRDPAADLLLEDS